MTAWGTFWSKVIKGDSNIAFRYSYSRNNRIIGEVRTEAGTTTTSSCTYDSLGEVTNFLQSTGHSEAYGHDKTGIMLGKVFTPGLTTLNRTKK